MRGTFSPVAPTNKAKPVRETQPGRRRLVIPDPVTQVRVHFRRGDLVPILCEFCGEVFDHLVRGPGRFPPLCEVCREDREARYYTKKRKR